jgi:hypothetical protein
MKSKQHKPSFLLLVLLFAATTAFFLSFFILVFTLVTSVRSWSDLHEFGTFLSALIGIMLVALGIIQLSGISVKRVLIEWLKENGYWFVIP